MKPKKNKCDDFEECIKFYNSLNKKQKKFFVDYVGEVDKYYMNLISKIKNDN